MSAVPATAGRGLTAVLVCAALAAGALAVGDPLRALTVVAAALCVALMMIRIELAVLVYVAIAPFADLVRSVSSVSVKGVGALLFAAWLARLVLDRRPLALRHGVIAGAGLLAGALLASTVLHPHGAAGAVVASRYASYLGVLVVLTDVVGQRTTARRVAVTFWWSCTLAAAVGLVGFCTSGSGRAAGPLADPNDFAFYLVCALPLGQALRRRATGRTRLARLAYDAAALLLLLAIALTFSRGALLGVAVMAAYGIASGLLRLRVVAGVLAGVAAAAALVATADPGLVHSSVEAKQHVAQQNVDDRFVTWSVAAEMTADDPLLGQGPGGFAANSDDYLGPRVTDPAHLDVAHQMYLDVSSELGLLGLAGLVTTMAAGFLGARRAGQGRGTDADLAGAVRLSFVAVAVAACFLSEQYYLPVWLLAALGAALDPRPRTGRRHTTATPAEATVSPVPTPAGRW